MNWKKVSIIGVIFLVAMVRVYNGYQRHQSDAVPAVKTVRKKSTTKQSSATSSKKTNPIKSKSTQTAGNHRAQAVQSVLNQYRNQKNVGVVYTDLKTGKTATINGDRMFYAASVAKLPVVAYVQHAIVTGKISWTTKFTYADAANALPNAMISGGTGTLQNENHQGKSYTVMDLTQRAIEQSDNQASNQLLYHVAHANEQDFKQYLQSTIGSKTYSKTMNAMQVNRVIIAVWQQKQKASTWLEQTNWKHDKIGTLPVTVAHKIGINGAANNDTAIVVSRHQFALTIMTDGWSDAQIAKLAQQIYAVAK
ncbi:Hypothetical protein ADU72_0521 [Pediococcus damnosus]|uniref:Beta-lactamase class A catalytic domain-containing protein n=2 Tax=Pediococcus damnosus TaxID=51663 RepID=A0ABM6A2C1_9LACO|nr:serine hydrolase [Pediococcus damnosus]AMV66466.1 Hypothetical protein ADU72_0521 [Pediococcus damnosus]PJE49921.1 serine hydrolase [Pediococcus damnosus]